MTSVATATISADELHELFGAGSEYALVDVREPGVTAAQGSILLAVSIPLSVLELRVRTRIPRLSTPVIVYDGGDDDRGDGSHLAARAAARLTALGYTDVRVLAGGLRAWSEAGHKVQTGGDHVIGQAFGEWIEHIYQTPHISVPEYLKRIEAGEDIVLLDSRPIGEFENHSLPGGTSIPGAELVYRAGEVVKSPDALVVVNCAGRTRSILGAQVLINAGLPNRVVALEGGTQSWVLEGHDLEHGKSVAAPAPSGESFRSAQHAAARFTDRFAITHIDTATLEQFRTEADTRSLYLLDVRTPGEYEAGHLPGSRSAPSWDVAPWTFRHVGTHNARIVLVDDDTVRATVAASWITQIGWGEVFVLDHALDGVELETGTAPQAFAVPDEGYTLIDADGLNEAFHDVVVLDLAPSPAYRTGHIPGASFAIRSRLAESVAEIPGAGPIVLTSEDGVLARFAAGELSGATDRPVRVLQGGTTAWEAAGYALESGVENWLHDADDVVPSGWRETDPERRKAGFRRYLSWELGLVAELEQDDTVPFKKYA
ncbi:rhodanese-like domain-containing protein [Mycobacterium sp. NPDC003449]